MRCLPKKIATAALLGLLVFADAAAPAYQASSHQPFPFAHAQYGCAPTDALAFDFYFTSNKSECGKYAEPYLEISIWKNLPKSAPYTIDIAGSEAAGVRCLRTGVCERATSGTLHLDQFIEGKSSSGEYELHFKGGSIEKAKFDAAWCSIRVVCG
ncbi:MAG TPA: hypothetical protein VKR60_09340 [Candidatus Sulfotelmatobacter sp.]|nr:hypothetical protein [Candidatus Sulfotelmatobacter sp.]